MTSNLTPYSSLNVIELIAPGVFPLDVQLGGVSLGTYLLLGGALTSQ